MNFKNMLEKTFDKHSDKTFLYYTGKGKINFKSYKELFVEIKSMGSCINNYIASTRKSCYVGISVKQNICMPTLILGCVQNELPVVYIDIENHTEFNIRLIENLPIAYIFMDAQSEELKHILKAPRLIDQFSMWNVKIQLWETGEIPPTINKPAMLYAMQTSGSTGTPKIIQVPEQAILPNISDLKKLWNVSKDDVILLASPPTFDPFMVELLLAVTSGAALLLVGSELRLSSHHLLDTVFPLHSRSLVTIAQLTPSIFTRWSTEQIRKQILVKESSLRVLALGGDKFPPVSWWQQCRAEGNQTQVYNLYGTTEVSCWAVVGSGTDGWLDLLLSETELKIVDKTGQTVKNGTGEVYIGSNTRICLVEDETWEQLRTPVFRATGDLVAVKNNRYKFIGRKDNLVKRWGHRVSLDTVESIAVEHSDVTAACCVIHVDVLALYICLRKDVTAVEVEESLRQTLLKRLNKASCPNVILVLDELPLNRHGKTNKNKLKKMLSDLKNEEITFKNQTDLFRSLWKKHTCEDETEDSGFLSVGGNSVGAMLIVNNMAAQGFDLSVTVLSQMLNNGTLTECCQLIESHCESLSKLIEPESVIKPDENLLKKITSTTNYVTYYKTKGSTNNLTETVKSDVELKIAWSYNLGKCVDASPTCIALRDGSKLAVVGAHSGRLAALSLESGQRLWETQLPDRIESSITPTCCGRQGLIGCYDSYVYCINLNSGHTLWKFKTSAMVKGTAVMIDESWIFGSYDYHVYCLSAQVGSLKWKQKMDGIVLATPLYLPQQSLVVVASLTGQLAAMDSSCGYISWSISLASPIFSSPCVVKDVLVVAEVEGTLHGIQIHSGIKVWQYQVGGKIFSSLVTLGDSVVFGCHDCSVHRVCVNESSSCQVWCQPSGSPVYATPAFVSSHHLVTAATSGLVSVLDVTNGSKLCSSLLPGELFSSPVACDDYVVVGCRDDNVYCFKIINKS